MLKISFRTEAGPRLIDTLRRKGPQIINVISKSLTAQMFKLASYIQTEKLSGQVLQARSGTLRGSVTTEPARMEGRKITASVSGAGGVAGYGVFHEAGVGHAWQIVAKKASALSFIVDGKRHFARSVIHPELKQRAFMRPSLEQKSTEIRDSLRDAVDKVVSEE